MLKLRTFCLFLLIMLNSSVVSARVCFLPGVFASDGCVGAEVLMACKDLYPQTTPCEEGQIQKECTDNGKTYYKCDCSPEHQVFDKEVAKKYDCTMKGGPDPVCGCLKGNMKCNRDLYPVAEGECQNGSKYSEDYCEDDEGIHFSSCVCGDEYAYTCAEEGLRAPDTEGISCHNSLGQTLYTHCECAELWQPYECSSNSCEATKGGPVATGRGEENCYLCGAEVCSIGEVNLETYFCAIPTTGIKTNCETLGYKYDVEGLCADGKDCGCLRCIFDENYVLCDKQEETECTYTSEEECLEHEGNETCVINYDGCYIVTECEYGYQFSADKTQCEEIVCSIDNKEYVSNQECEASMENSVCEEDEKGCYKVSGCVYGYIMSADETECEEDCSLKKTPLNGDYVMCDTANGFGGNEEDKCVNSARPDKVYYPKCMKAETCYDVIKGTHSPYFANGGFCDFVLPEGDAQKYLKQGYYKADECQPVDASVEKKYRLHACKDTRLDCLGSTSSVDDARYTTSCISPDDRGTTKECGGQTYKICQCNNLNRADNCGVVQVSGKVAESLVAGMPINGYLFTGEIKDGCTHLRQQYVYVRDFRSVGRDNKKCKNIKEPIDDAVAVCVNGQSVCPEGENGESNALATSGVYTRCKVPCYFLCKPGQTVCPKNPDGTSNVVETKELSIYQLCTKQCVQDPDLPIAIRCQDYAINNNMEVNKSGGNCTFDDQPNANLGWKKLGELTVAGSNGLKRTCYYKASCTSPLTGDCLKLDSDFKMVTKGYKACGRALANVPLKQDYEECGGYYYSLSCCADKSGCYVENDAQKLENLLNTGLYYHVLSDVLADEAGACHYYAKCDASGQDCNKGYSPFAQGRVTKEQCESAGSVPLTPVPGCGGKYYESCSADCTYKETETSCRQVGLAFEPKCVASGTISYGICVERSDEEG